MKPSGKYEQHKRTVDITGHIYGDLRVLRTVGANNEGRLWECVCVCGTLVEANAKSLRRKNCPIRSCGKCVSGVPNNKLGKDISGRTWNSLTAIMATDRLTKDKRPLWLFRCICGVEKILQVAAVKSGGTKSCGCTRWSSSALNRTQRDGALKAWLGQRKNSAKHRGLTIGIDDIKLIELAAHPCHYCGVAPEDIRIKFLEQRGKTAEREGKDFYGALDLYDPYYLHGLDRVDSAKGYDAGNVVSCCYTCNRAKMDSNYDQFIDMCRRIAHRHP